MRSIINVQLIIFFCVILYYCFIVCIMIIYDIGSISLSALHCCATLLLFSVPEIERQAVIALKVMKTLPTTLFASVKGNSETKFEKTCGRILRAALSIREAPWRQTQTEELTERLIKLICSINTFVGLRASLLHVCPPQRSWFERSCTMAD